MACCTSNTWTKIIAVFTIIICLPYIVLEILILSINSAKYVDILKIQFYIAWEDPAIDILLYFSIILNALWIISSIILLISLGNTESQQYSIILTQRLVKAYLSWIIIAFMTFVVEIVSIIIHILHYSDPPLNLNLYIDGAKYLLYLSTRFGGILALHMFSWFGMIIITSAVQKSVSHDSTTPIGRIVPLKPPKPALKPSKVPYLEHNNVDRVQNWYKHYEGDNQNSSNGSNYYMEPNAVPQSHNQYIPRLNGNTNPAFVNNNNYGPMSRAPVPPTKPPPPPPPQHQIMPGSNTNVLVNGVTSGTLRRQLPWSYMPMGGELPQRAPWKQSSVPSNGSGGSGFTPYVPAPDYNGSNPRKTQRQEFSQPGWSQYL